MSLIRNYGPEDLTLSKIAKDNDRISEENNELKKALQQLKIELAQRDIKIR